MIFCGKAKPLISCSTTQTSKQKPIYVISDLHIGNGSAKDNLIKNDRGRTLMRFLDHVQHSDGKLVICGDLFELWRYPLEDILDAWKPLIDRLAEMDVSYIPGNHDPLLDNRYAAVRQWHPLFRKLSAPFLQTLGGKRFKFMHGHEIDPVVADAMVRLAPVFRLFTGALEFRRDCCLVTSDRVTDILLEAGEQILRLWHTLTRRVNQAIDESLFPLSGEGLIRLKQPIRMRNMMWRFYRQQEEGLYDITITGHTHYAGRFGRWYYNCGCWTRPTAGFLRIDPDGEACVCDWTEQGERINNTVLTI